MTCDTGRATSSFAMCSSTICLARKIHSSLRVTQAMAAGVSTRLMDMSDLVALLVESESTKAA